MKVNPWIPVSLFFFCSDIKDRFITAFILNQRGATQKEMSRKGEKYKIVILLSLEHSKHLKPNVSRVFQGSFKGVLRKFQGCFKEVSRVLQGSFKGVLRRFQGCSKEISRVFQGSFKEASRTFQKSFKGV